MLKTHIIETLPFIRDMETTIKKCCQDSRILFLRIIMVTTTEISLTTSTKGFITSHRKSRGRIFPELVNLATQ